MFTGLVEEVGTVRSLVRDGEQAVLTLACSFADALGTGDSVAVNGCCLTATTMSEEEARFDLLAQTLEVTSLGQLEPGSLVNLERALAADGRFGGHFVQGHVDGIGTITELSPRGSDHHFEVELPEHIARYCIDKGSLAVDGISLTIAELAGRQATFWITPHTFEATNLAAAAKGDTVNLEADLLAKYVERLLDARGARESGV